MPKHTPEIKEQDEVVDQTRATGWRHDLRVIGYNFLSTIGGKTRGKVFGDKNTSLGCLNTEVRFALTAEDKAIFGREPKAEEEIVVAKHARATGWRHDLRVLAHSFFSTVGGNTAGKVFGDKKASLGFLSSTPKFEITDADREVLNKKVRLR